VGLASRSQANGVLQGHCYFCCSINLRWSQWPREGSCLISRVPHSRRRGGAGGDAERGRARLLFLTWLWGVERAETEGRKQQVYVHSMVYKGTRAFDVSVVLWRVRRALEVKQWRQRLASHRAPTISSKRPVTNNTITITTAPPPSPAAPSAPFKHFLDISRHTADNRATYVIACHGTLALM
jgi:hypothetical protein